MSIVSNTMNWAQLEAKRTNRSKTAVLLDMTANYIRYGVLPQEYFHFGFYGKSVADKKSYFTYRLYSERRKEYSNPEYENVIFQDKFIFSKVFSEFYGRESFLLSKAIDRKSAIDFIQRVKKFVYKPLKAQEGIGIKSYTLSNYKSVEALYDALPKGVDALLDEWIIQAPEMSKFYEEGVNCIRVYTFLHNNIFRFVDAKVSFGVGSDIVNATLDSSIFGIVDVNTGIITSDLANYNLDVFKEHPITHFKAKGTQLPRWNEVLELARKAAYVVPQVAYVGWDIAITDKGPVLIEGNHCGGCGGNQFCVLREDTRGTRDTWDVMGK